MRSSETVKRRRGTNLGMLLLNTESETNRSIPAFYFTLDGDISLQSFRERWTIDFDPEVDEEDEGEAPRRSQGR